MLEYKNEDENPNKLFNRHLRVKPYAFKEQPVCHFSTFEANGS